MVNMKVYVAIVIVLEVYSVQYYCDFWCCKWTYTMGTTWSRQQRVQGLTNCNHYELSWILYYNTFSSLLLQYHFKQIKQYLHVCNPNISLTDSEWYQKLEPLSKSICKCLQELAVPSANVSVDEIMV